MVNAKNILEILQRYFTDTAVVAMAAIAILFLLKDAEKKYRYYVVILAVSMVLLFNDIVYQIILRFGEADTFYRFLWIIPITILCGYLGTEIWYRLTGKTQKILYAMILLVLIFTSSRHDISNWGKRYENIYQIPDEQIEAAEIIVAHQRFWRPTLWDDGTLSDGIREYDGTIMLELDTAGYMDKMITGRVINDKGSTVREILVEKTIDTLGIRKERVLAQKLFESGGAFLIGETKSSYLYRFEWRDVVKRQEMLQTYYNEAITYINEEYITIGTQEEAVELLYLSDMHIDIATSDSDYENANGVSASEQFIQWIKMANAYDVDAVLLGANMLDNDSEENRRFFEAQLATLNMPYVWIEDERHTILDMGSFKVCAIEGRDDISDDSLQEKPIILLTGEPFEVNESDRHLPETVVSVLSGGTQEFCKNVLQEGIVQYTADASYIGEGTLVVVQP